MYSNINGCLKTFILWKELPKDLIINLKKPLHENINDCSLPFFFSFKKENNSSKQLLKQFTCSLLLMCSLCLSSTIFTKQLSFLAFLVIAPLLAPPSRDPSFSPMLRCLFLWYHWHRPWRTSTNQYLITWMSVTYKGDQNRYLQLDNEIIN